MPGTADPDRIRRIRRESVFARFADPDVLVDFPAAQDGWQNPRESLFDNVDDAQALLDELAGALAVSRAHEAAESDSPLGIGRDIAIQPVLPLAQMVDRSIGLNAAQTIKGVSVDFHTERNSIETIG